MLQALIAESMNRDRRPVIEMLHANYLDLNQDRYVALMQQLGVFRRGSGWQQLAYIDVRLDQMMWTMNLMPPTPSSQPWESELARRTAKKLMTHPTFVRMDRILLCGANLLDAFDLPQDLKLGESYRKFVRVPHPSPLNPTWSDESEVQRIKHAIQ